MNSKYDPFARGPFPVGVRTEELNDRSRQRKLPVEFWYPATDDYKGQDLDKKTQDNFTIFYPVNQEAVRDAKLQIGNFPLIIFSHGGNAHRRQSTYLCCHLASHGYIVVSPDHLGDTIIEIGEAYMKYLKGGSLEDLYEMERNSIKNRPIDITFIIDKLLVGETWVPLDSIDAEHIGITGHSFGGWTALVVPNLDIRLCAVLALAPGGGDSSEKRGDSQQLEGEKRIIIREFWEREVGILYLVAEFDHLVPLEAVIDLYSRTPEPKQMVILNNADHYHFCDDIERVHEYFRTQAVAMGGDNPETKALAAMQPASELHPSKGAYDYTRGLGLAHMDIYLKGKNEAEEFLSSDLKTLLAEQDIDVSLY